MEEIRIVPILSEINALELLYNNAINNVDVTMGGKKVELSQIIEALKAKLDRLYGQLEDILDPETGGITPVAGKTTMSYQPMPNQQLVDVRPTERYKG